MGKPPFDPLEYDAKDLHCSFCGNSEKRVKRLIAGPTVYICDQCIGLCADIIAADRPPTCSFCTKKVTEVEALFKSESREDCFICNECVESMQQILDERAIKPAEAEPTTP